jgi:preprotein translocase subunit SecG
MTTLFIILIILASVILGLIVLVQNPKGGGLTGNIAGFSSQFMGVKQTTDVLEKGTWIFATVIAALCLLSSFFITGRSTSSSPDIAIPSSQQAPVTSPLLPTPTPGQPAGQPSGQQPK